jgi:hypothetical protein
MPKNHQSALLGEVCQLSARDFFLYQLKKLLFAECCIKKLDFLDASLKNIGRVSQLGPENDACLMKFAPHKLCFALGALPPNPRSFFRHGTIRHKPSGTITPAALPLAWLHCFC